MLQLSLNYIIVYFKTEKIVNKTITLCTEASNIYEKYLCQFERLQCWKVNLREF